MKIILIEGLPGSGKTTFAKRISQYLDANHIDNKFFSEGDLHPVDLAWTSILSETDLERMITEYPQLADKIACHVKQTDDGYLLAYTNIEIDERSKGFYDYCQHFEIYNTDDLDYFFREHVKLWESFVKENADTDKTYIFECVFLQNHINEIMLKYDLNIEQTINYFRRFSEVFSEVEVKLFYIDQIDVKTIFDKTINERRSRNKALYKDWIDHVIEYFEGSKNAHLKNYLGYDGALRFFQERKELEHRILQGLDFEVVIAELDKDYDSVFDIMKSNL
ncbi:MAG: hypothetical protein JXB20_04500 [Bacilli bacterium]|nr:hypothetical protein [Bacilli bacterium]